MPLFVTMDAEWLKDESALAEAPWLLVTVTLLLKLRFRDALTFLPSSSVLPDFPHAPGSMFIQ